MVFSSSVFLFLFLPAVFIADTLIKTRYSNILLLGASLLFYAWGEPYYVFLMITSIALNWLVGIAIAKTSGSMRRLALVAGVTCDLLMLGYYKYAGFLVSIVNSAAHRTLLPIPHIELPIGISFFTFQAISYIADVYRGETEASGSIVNVALYISFFPQLIAGPIVKYKDINEQIKSRSTTWVDTAEGFKRFIYGLSKKVLISNVLGLCADTVFAFDPSAFDCRAAWIGALAYTFQIYYDFSGYSDMAIGLGRMFGFTILENFDYPYMSGSVSEFWRRWHISLGSWFREYVYIPLGGNRRGTARTYINLIIVFFLTGLWHGADFSFVLWGLYHGFFQIMERLGLKRLLARNRIMSVIYTFAVVSFGWVLFRADSTAAGLCYMSRLLTPGSASGSIIPTYEYMDLKTVFTLVVAAVGMGFLRYLVPEKLHERWRDSIPEAIFCIVMLILSLASITNNTYNPFIYFQF